MRLLKTIMIAGIFMVTAAYAEVASTKTPFEKPGVGVTNQAPAVTEAKSVAPGVQAPTSSARGSSVKVHGSVGVGIGPGGVMRNDARIHVSDPKSRWHFSVGSSRSRGGHIWR